MADAAIVQTDSGPVRGALTDGHRLFQGIPYAASTGGRAALAGPPAGAAGHHLDFWSGLP
jgi:para-nitrobenzyl esterase